MKIEIPVKKDEIYNSEFMGCEVAKVESKELIDQLLEQSVDDNGKVIGSMATAIAETGDTYSMEIALKKILPAYIKLIEDDTGVYTGALKLALNVIKSSY